MSTNYNLLNEIDNYITDKAEMYDYIKKNDDIRDLADELLITSPTQMSITNTPDFLERQALFQSFINDQFNNNNKIASYYNKQISSLNKTILDKQAQLARIKQSNIDVNNINNVNKKNIEYSNNELLKLRIIFHILLISCLVTILILLLCILHKYDTISIIILIISCSLLIIALISYIIYIYHTKYPRRYDDYNAFMFKNNQDQK